MREFPTRPLWTRKSYFWISATGRISVRGFRSRIMSKANYYRIKSAACVKIAEDAKVSWEIRAQYRELANAWKECAIEAEWIEARQSYDFAVTDYEKPRR